LSREKGIETLLRAWRRLGRRITLKIAGDGPLSGEVGRAARETHGIEWLGRVREREVVGLMKRAEFLVLPSLWYEGFPMVVAEAYASGLPVLASDLGSLSTLVISGRTGLKFSPRSAGDLEDKAEALLDDPALLERLRLGAREEFETHYTADRNYTRLMEIYARVA
ncbi:MAG: glycosyltransferase family 4 protein, partial [Rubrobacteraceae bacterium]|nr:glycosyltransferase family 4 protein [Rubrobacteraceae bacterium]